jgi:hypothetical protein
VQVVALPSVVQETLNTGSGAAGVLVGLGVIVLVGSAVMLGNAVWVSQYSSFALAVSV